MSGVIYHRRVPAKYVGEAVRVGSETSCTVQFGNGGSTDEKMGGGAGGGRTEDVLTLIMSDKNGRDQE